MSGVGVYRYLCTVYRSCTGIWQMLGLLPPLSGLDDVLDEGGLLESLLLVEVGGEGLGCLELRHRLLEAESRK